MYSTETSPNPFVVEQQPKLFGGHVYIYPRSYDELQIVWYPLGKVKIAISHSYPETFTYFCTYYH